MYPFTCSFSQFSLHAYCVPGLGHVLEKQREQTELLPSVRLQSARETGA